MLCAGSSSSGASLFGGAPAGCAFYGFWTSRKRMKAVNTYESCMTLERLLNLEVAGTMKALTAWLIKLQHSWGPDAGSLFGGGGGSLSRDVSAPQAVVRAEDRHGSALRWWSGKHRRAVWRCLDIDISEHTAFQSCDVFYVRGWRRLLK